MSRVVLDVEQTAAKLGVAAQTLYKWRSNGTDTPRAFKIGKRLRWYEDVVDAWIAVQAEGAMAA